MSYQEDITTAVLACAPIAEIIGDRFWWDFADGSTGTPYLVAQTITVSGETDLGGDRSLGFPTVQFTAWGPLKSECISIIAAIRQIEGFQLPGTSKTSLVYNSEESTRDPQTRYFGEIIEYTAPHTLN